jgi:hypothetical protein
MPRKITLHNLEEKNREVDRDEAETVFGGSNNYGMSANTGTKSGGNASNYGNQTAGSGGDGGSVGHGETYGNNTAGSGGSSWQSAMDMGQFQGADSSGGTGGNITNVGAEGGIGGAGGNAIGVQTNINDNIINEISVPVTMNI